MRVTRILCAAVFAAVSASAVYAQSPEVTKPTQSPEATKPTQSPEVTKPTQSPEAKPGLVIVNPGSASASSAAGGELAAAPATAERVAAEPAARAKSDTAADEKSGTEKAGAGKPNGNTAAGASQGDANKGVAAEGEKSEAAAEDAAMSEAAAISKAEEKKAAEAPPTPPKEPTLAIDIDLGTQRMTVSDNGEQLYSWAVSSGRSGYRTPTGTFNPVWMTKMWYSRQYEYAPMPNSIFFHGGAAIHATSAVSQLGSPASHGCVRLAPSHAATLYKLVSRHGKSMTKIVVHGTPKYDAEVASREDAPRNAQRYDYRRSYGLAYNYPPPGYRSRYYDYRYSDYEYRARDRARRYYAAPRRYARPRGLFGGGGYYYGYGY
ncbi:MAG: L,D-transpeptidase [Hyphomicrobium sp.]|jgi:lipoprotein-anchoring transpeptidase ErfK/SrfK